MIGTRGWAFLTTLLLLGTGGTASAQRSGGCGGQRPAMNQMRGGMGMGTSQLGRGGYPGTAQMAAMQQQLMLQQQLLYLQQSQLQADAMGADLMASLYAADIRRYQDRLRQLQKAQQQQLQGGR